MGRSLKRRRDQIFNGRARAYSYVDFKMLVDTVETEISGTKDGR